jgi:hypothetical protein
MERKTWKEFKDCKLLWWVNRSLHIFGWAIVYEEETDGTITNVYPARVPWRGFSEAVEEEGFTGLTQHIAKVSEDLLKDVDT